MKTANYEKNQGAPREAASSKKLLLERMSCVRTWCSNLFHCNSFNKMLENATKNEWLRVQKVAWNNVQTMLQFVLGCTPSSS